MIDLRPDLISDCAVPHFFKTKFFLPFFCFPFSLFTTSLEMPVVRTQLYGWQPSVGDSRESSIRIPHENLPSSLSSHAEATPPPSIYSLQPQMEPAAQSPKSISSASSRRASIDSAYSVSGDRRAQRNLERDPSWVPRPRNAFIIFRCDYAREHCLSKDGGSGTSKDIRGDKTLSKRASEAWSSMPASERERYKELAEIEKEEHARANPGYRFRPAKRVAPTKRNVRPWPDVKATQQLQRSQTENMAMEYAMRRPDGRRFSESHVAPNDAPPVPVKTDKLVKAARRRSSSVPLLGTEYGQYLLPWLTPEELLMR